jgi:hypothetical protein
MSRVDLDALVELAVAQNKAADYKIEDYAAKAEFYPFLTKEVTRLYDEVLRHLSDPGEGESADFVM